MQYPLKLFQIDNLDFALKVATDIKFATVIFIQNQDIQLVSVPVIARKENNIWILQGHMWKNNPLYELLNNSDNSVKSKIIFNAANDYISPVVYAEKKNSGNVVPTWNYLEAQFNGALYKTTDHELINILTDQVSEFETMVQGSWHMTDASAQYLTKLQQIIFGFKLPIDTFSVTAKMSQNKSTEDIENIFAWYNRPTEPKKNLAYWSDILSGY